MINSIIDVRPHHLLCLKGFKGFSYNESHIKSWNNLAGLFSSYPETKIKIEMGPDVFCKECPKNPEKGGVCDKNFVEQLDEKTRKFLGLNVNETYVYQNISNLLTKLLDPEKHAELCGDCGWRKKGFCIDSFEKKTESFAKCMFI